MVHHTAPCPVACHVPHPQCKHQWLLHPHPTAVPPPLLLHQCLLRSDLMLRAHHSHHAVADAVCSVTAVHPVAGATTAAIGPLTVLILRLLPLFEATESIEARPPRLCSQAGVVLLEVWLRTCLPHPTATHPQRVGVSHLHTWISAARANTGDHVLSCHCAVVPAWLAAVLGHTVPHGCLHVQHRRAMLHHDGCQTSSLSVAQSVKRVSHFSFANIIVAIVVSFSVVIVPSNHV